MTEAKADFVGTHKYPFFKASLRLWSYSEPLEPVIPALGSHWPHLDVKGQLIPARGRVKAHFAPQHYASSEDIKDTNIENIVAVISQWLDNIERCAPPTATLVKAGKIEAVIWVALFGYDPVIPPELPVELEIRAKKAGVKVFIENYTIMDEETGAPAKRFFGAED
ncbi:hypothetical protein [Rhodoblastus sp.]|uniref:hypothetical protein n=1 Tax=Rhodoblastus sp. TaxID=1962975 RepID=UPI0035B1177E